MSKKCYTGVGSRKTPRVVWEFMYDLARLLVNLGYTARTGNAKGADRAIRVGAHPDVRVYWPREATNEAMRIAAELHPKWDKLNDWGQRLHGRNVMQVLGEDLMHPSEFVVCWTPDGCERHEDRGLVTGGTGTAISVASQMGIPVFNVYNPDSWHTVAAMFGIELEFYQ